MGCIIGEKSLFGPGKLEFGPSRNDQHGPHKSMIISKLSAWSTWSIIFYNLWFIRNFDITVLHEKKQSPKFRE